jgi:hypothetical protein
MFANCLPSCARLAVITVAAVLAADPARAQIDCSTVFCTAADQALIGGYPMFNETNFAPMVDGFGRTRLFWVHIPQQYDTIGADQ